MKLMHSLLIAFVLASLYFGTTANAQTTVTIGTGTSSNYSYGPIYRSSATSTFDYSQYHYLYTAADLAAVGIVPGSTITSLAFEKNSAFVLTGTGDAFFDLYLKNSATSALPASESWANLTTGSTLVGAYTLNTTNNLPAATGWWTLTLTTPYVYSGGSIELSVNWDCSAIAGNPSDGAFNWLYGTYSAGTSLGLAAGAVITGNLTDGSYGGTERPNTQFTYTAPACAGPTGLNATNILSSTADLGWTASGSAVGYNWKVVVAGAGSGGAAVASGTTTGTTASAAGLSPVTSYDLYIESDCGGTFSLFSGPYNFMTGCVNTLNGTYTVGGVGADFADIAAAVLELNTCGISGPVTFNVAAGTYTGAISIGQITGSSATNTVTFNGAGSGTTTIAHDGTVQYATIQLNGADYVTFQNFTIANTATTNGWGVQLLNQSDFNTIDNCIINMETVTVTSVIGVLSSNSSTSISTTGNNANNTTISNTTINGGYYGVRFYGNTSATLDQTNNTVSNCTFNNTNTYAIYFYYQDNPIATGNIVNSTVSTSGYGIYSTSSRHGVFTGNTLIGMKTYGIYLGTVNTATQTPTQRTLVANNMITALGLGDGLYATTTNNFDVYNNSISSEDDQALWLSTSALNFDIRNNIFVASGTSQVIDFDANPTATDVIDFNVYHHSGGGDIVIMPAGTYSTLAAWQTADLTKNVNSLSGDPSFVNATDLHVLGTIANDAGTSIAVITTDIDGDARSATTPDIGADEYTPPACAPPVALTATNLTATSADLGWTVGSTETIWDVEYGGAGFLQGSGTLVTGTMTNPYAATMLTPDSDYEFYVRANCGGSSSPWVGPFSFSTPCVAYTIPYFEGFEAGYTQDTDVDGCLTQESVVGTNNWTANNTLTTYNRSPRTGAWNAFLRYGNTDWVFIPVELVGGTSYTTDVYARQDGATATNSDIEISYGIANNAAAMTNSIAPATGIVNGNYQLITGAFTPAVSGVYYVGIKGYMNSSPWYISIDDIAIYESPSCVPPSVLTATNITATSADLGWTSTASNWQVEYAAAGFTPGTGTTFMTSTNPHNLTGLTADSDYDFYVRAVCSPGDTSTWVGPFSFATPCNAYTIPYFEGFESGYTHNTEVAGCLSQESVLGTQVWTANNTLTDYNRSPRTGAWNSFLRYGNTDWLFIPIELVGGTSYTTDVYARQDGATATNSDIEISFGTAGNAAAMTNSIVPATGIINGNYQLISGTFTPVTSGVYYVGIKGYMNSSPWYISVDDIAIYETPACLPTTFSQTFSECQGFSVVVGTNTYNATGVYTDVLTTAAGCDSTVTTDLTINSPATGTDTQVVCDSITWIDGITYTANNTSAMFTITNGAASGCDSIVTLNLTITGATSGTDVLAECDSYTWIDGNTYTADNNTATFMLQTAAGCDSLVTLDLTILNSSSSTEVVSSCSDYVWAVDGMTYTASGMYTAVIPNAAGCDSTITLDLTIGTATSSTTTVAACGNYVWDADGMTYSTAGTYTATLVNSNGCDSVATLILTIATVSNTGVTVSGATLTADLLLGPGVSMNWLNCDNAFAPIPGASGQSYTPTINGNFAVRIVENGCVDTSACYLIDEAGLDNNNLTAVSIVPNPTNNAVKISFEASEARLTILDLNGKILQELTVNSGDSVDMSTFENGVYLFTIYTDSIRTIERVVKQ